MSGPRLTAARPCPRNSAKRLKASMCFRCAFRMAARVGRSQISIRIASLTSSQDAPDTANRKKPPNPIAHRLRSPLPANTPVGAPSATAARPFTKTQRIPVESFSGST